MQITSLRCSSTALAWMASSVLSATTLAQTTSHLSSSNPADVPATVRSAVALPIDELLFDSASDGALWVRGSDYKARFAADGATVVPYFGSDAPQNFPLAFHADAAFVGGAALALRSPSVAHRGDVVSIDRGAFVEEYELALGSLEQRFVFPRVDAAGDLVLRVGVASELQAEDLGETLRFANDLGSVGYGAALAIDANGHRLALDSTLVDGAIQFVVPAAFVAEAAMPLTIDPLITFFTVQGQPLAEIEPDVSYDLTTDRWCVVWTSVFSSTDHDVFGRLVAGNGALQPGVLQIDFTGEKWTLPKIANSGSADNFLVCAEVTPFIGASDIRGRFVFPGTSQVGTAFPISPSDGVPRSVPDIGGDPHTGTPSFYCVVWQRPFSANDIDIEMQFVHATGGLFGGLGFLEHTSALAELPSISNSTGLHSGSSTPAWTVVWQERVSANDHDVWGARVKWNGGIAHARFPITSGPDDDTTPAVSTSLDPAPGAGDRPYLVVFERQWGVGDNIGAALMQGNQVLDVKDLTATYEGAPLSSDQFAPAVDSDGSQFLVGYCERTTPSSFDGNIKVSNYYAWNSTLFPLATYQGFAGSPADERYVALCSMASSGGPRQRYFGTWSFLSPNNHYDAIGGLWDGAGGGHVSGFCDSDNGVPCPCGSPGVEGRGCANSASPSGAEMTFTGDASATLDTFALHVSGLPPSTTCLFFQGTAKSNGGMGVTFGDGKRCVAGAITRIGLKSGIAGTASYPELGDASISVQGHVPFAGTTRYYQAWYRDAATFCTTETFNLTNGIAVFWAP